MSDYHVTVLKPGYAIWQGPTQQRADGTITLIRGPKNIIVDTGGPWDKQMILKLLRKQKLPPSAIDYVVCTHGHSDHTGNNNLFPNATLILSYDVCKGDLYTFHDFPNGQPYRIDDAVDVISTPGHTHQDISVIVRSQKGIYAVVGDLFECADDLTDESLWRSFSEFPELHEKSRKTILERADFIVPGHGDVFRVREGRLVPLDPPKHAGPGATSGSRILWYILIPLLVSVAGGLIAWLATRHPG